MKKKITGLSDLQSAKESAGHGTPSAILSAFIPAFTEAGAVVLPPLDMGKVLLLEQIASPFISRADRPTKIADIVQAIFILANPSNAESRRIIGSGTFPDAIVSFADTLPVRALSGAAEQINAHIEAGFATAVPYGKGESGPLAPHPSPATDSGGSSPSPIA